jgi:alanine racemase
MYGLYPNPELELPYRLEPVMDFKAVISEIKTIRKGDCVSYGRTYCAEKDVKIATVTVGYADGYSRLLSSRADILVNGQKCRIAGRVCMDQLMIDISSVKSNVKAGDTVTLIGSDGENTITADDLAGLYGTIGYEVVCGISKRVPRVYFY